MMTGTKRNLQNAINRSHEIDPRLSRVTWIGGRSYIVKGQHDTYSVDVNGHNWRCSCPAGKAERACWHCASVWRLRVAREMGAKVEPVAALKAPRQERQREEWL